MDHQRVPFADKRKERLQLGALGVLARGVVGEDAIHRHLLELPLRVLVERADPDVTDPLTVHAVDVSG